MQTSPSHRRIRLRFTVLGVEPAVWREVDVDPSLRLSDLHCAIHVAFDGWDATHHVFCDEAPVFGPDDEDADAWLYRGGRSPWEYGTPTMRRWGDRWTMIDMHDPEVIAESEISVGSVMASSILYYSFLHSHGHDDQRWWVGIEVVSHEVVAASTRSIEVVGGANRTPVLCVGPAVFTEWIDLLADIGSDVQEWLQYELDCSVGPWATYDPTEFDLGAARAAMDDHFRAGADSTEMRPPDRTRIERLISALPASNQPGLRAHVARCGALLPALVTPEEAARTVRAYAWILRAGADGGIPLVSGTAAADVCETGALELGIPPERVRDLVASARQLGLLYARRERLRVPQWARVVDHDSVEVWELLAERIGSGSISGACHEVTMLFFLGMIDGSLDDPDAGLRVIWRAFDQMQLVARHSWSRRSTAATRAWATAYGRRSSSRYAVEELRGDPAMENSGRAIDPRLAEERGVIEIRVMLAPLVKVLEPLGLVETLEGGWMIPAHLREFARAVLS